jgi:hypothetical protein
MFTGWAGEMMKSILLALPNMSKLSVLLSLGGSRG